MTSTPSLAAAAAPTVRRPLGAVLLAAGGASWIVKCAIIAATSGSTDADPATAVFYLLGVALMIAGAAALGWHLSAGRAAVLRIGSVVLGGISVIAAYLAIDAALPKAGPSWFEDEVGIIATGIVAVVLGVLALRSAGRTA